LSSAFHSDYAIANKQVAKIARMQPDRFFGFAFVHAAHDRGRIGKMVGLAVEHHGSSGIKLHPL
jgi:uncharacterized protein